MYRSRPRNQLGSIELLITQSKEVENGLESRGG
jgi:hypothetical protein